MTSDCSKNTESHSNKIEFIIPEWAIGKHIYIFAGRELLAQKQCLISHENKQHIVTYHPLEVKPSDGRCNPESCKPNSCCTYGGLPKSLITELLDALLEYDSNNPECPLLTDNGCLMKGWIPFSCARSICTVYEGCTERVEVVE